MITELVEKLLATDSRKEYAKLLDELCKTVIPKLVELLDTEMLANLADQEHFPVEGPAYDFRRHASPNFMMFNCRDGEFYIATDGVTSEAITFQYMCMFQDASYNEFTAFQIPVADIEKWFAPEYTEEVIRLKTLARLKGIDERIANAEKYIKAEKENLEMLYEERRKLQVIEIKGN